MTPRTGRPKAWWTPRQTEVLAEAEGVVLVEAAPAADWSAEGVVLAEAAPAAGVVVVVVVVVWLALWSAPAAGAAEAEVEGVVLVLEEAD